MGIGRNDMEKNRALCLRQRFLWVQHFWAAVQSLRLTI